jgi:hypothetical protein
MAALTKDVGNGPWMAGLRTYSWAAMRTRWHWKWPLKKWTGHAFLCRQYVRVPVPGVAVGGDHGALLAAGVMVGADCVFAGAAGRAATSTGDVVIVPA